MLPLVHSVLLLTDLSNNWSWEPIFGRIGSGRFTQVKLYLDQQLEQLVWLNTSLWAFKRGKRLHDTSTKYLTYWSHPINVNHIVQLISVICHNTLPIWSDNLICYSTDWQKIDWFLCVLFEFYILADNFSFMLDLSIGVVPVLSRG